MKKHKFSPGDKVYLEDITGSTGSKLLKANPTRIFTVDTVAWHQHDPDEEMLTLVDSVDRALAARFRKIQPVMPFYDLEEILEAQELVNSIEAGG
jgi:hypothetical protein